MNAGRFPVHMGINDQRVGSDDHSRFSNYYHLGLKIEEGKPE